MNELKTKAINGIFLVFLSNATIQIIRFFSKIILARLLVPADFGAIAIAMMIISALSLFKNFGITTALIHKQKDAEEAADTAFSMTIILGVLLTIITYFIAPLIADFFAISVIKPILKVLSITFFISSFSVIPTAVVDKKLLFKKAVLPDLCSIIFSCLVSIVFAFLGFGVWSLVFGILTDSLIRTILYLIISPFKPLFKFNLEIIKELVGYGKHLLLAGIIFFLLTNIDNIIIGKLLGATQLGFYALAYTIIDLAIVGITRSVNKVTLPTYSMLQDKKETLKRAYLKVLNYISLLAIPITIGIFVLAPEAVILLFGVKWVLMILPLRILCFYGVVRAITSTTNSVFNSTGKPYISKRLAFLQLILTVLIIYPLTVKYGIVGTSIAVLIPMIFIFFLAFYEISKLINIKYIILWKTLFFPFVTSLIIGGLIFIIKNLIGMSSISLAILIGFSVLLYLIAVILLKPEVFYEVKGLLLS